MAWLTLAVAFRARGTPPAGEPPRFTVRAESFAVEAIGDDYGALPTRVEYRSSVTLTGETSFVEDAVMTFDRAEDRLELSTIEQGFLGPSPEEGLLHGSVMWRVDGGAGRFADAAGIVVSNFTFTPADGRATDHQVVKLRVP